MIKLRHSPISYGGSIKTHNSLWTQFKASTWIQSKLRPTPGNALSHMASHSIVLVNKVKLSFWFDDWLGSCYLSEWMVISQLLISVGDFSPIDKNFLLQLIPSRRSSLIPMSMSFTSADICDSWIWKLTEDGFFSLASPFGLLDLTTLPMTSLNSCGTILFGSKSLCMWRVFNGFLSLPDFLWNHGCNLPSRFVMCVNTESFHHSHTSCPKMRKLFGIILLLYFRWTQIAVLPN